MNSSQISYPHSPQAAFEAIPPLSSPDRSLTLIFASFAGVFTESSDDLWIPAHIPQNLGTTADNGSIVETQYFTTEKPINVLACTEQHQLCNPNEPNNCTPLQSIDMLLGSNVSVNSVSKTDFQTSLANIIITAAWRASMYHTIGFLGYELLASNLAQGSISLPLPDDQWVQEVNNWNAISMNILQRFMVDTATGPSGINAAYTNGQADSDPGLLEFCNSQIIQRSDFMNFSILAISLVFGLGGLVILLSLFLEDLVRWLRQKFQRGLYKQARWQLDATLQLQRMAFQGSGLGTWKGGAEDIPLTETGEKFAPAIEWADLYPDVNRASAREEFLSPLRKVEIVTGDFSFETVRSEDN